MALRDVGPSPCAHGRRRSSSTRARGARARARRGGAQSARPRLDEVPQVLHRHDPAPVRGHGHLEADRAPERHDGAPRGGADARLPEPGLKGCAHELRARVAGAGAGGEVSGVSGWGGRCGRGGGAGELGDGEGGQSGQACLERRVERAAVEGDDEGLEAEHDLPRLACRRRSGRREARRRFRNLPQRLETEECPHTQSLLAPLGSRAAMSSKLDGSCEQKSHSPPFVRPGSCLRRAGGPR